MVCGDLQNYGPATPLDIASLRDEAGTNGVTVRIDGCAVQVPVWLALPPAAFGLAVSIELFHVNVTEGGGVSFLHGADVASVKVVLRQSKILVTTTPKMTEEASSLRPLLSFLSLARLTTAFNISYVISDSDISFRGALLEEEALLFCVSGTAAASTNDTSSFSNISWSIARSSVQLDSANASGCVASIVAAARLVTNVAISAEDSTLLASNNDGLYAAVASISSRDATRLLSVVGFSVTANRVTATATAEHGSAVATGVTSSLGGVLRQIVLAAHASFVSATGGGNGVCALGFVFVNSDAAGTTVISTTTVTIVASGRSRISAGGIGSFSNAVSAMAIVAWSVGDCGIDAQGVRFDTRESTVLATSVGGAAVGSLGFAAFHRGRGEHRIAGVTVSVTSSNVTAMGYSSSVSAGGWTAFGGTNTFWTAVDVQLSLVKSTLNASSMASGAVAAGGCATLRGGSHTTDAWLVAFDSRIVSRGESNSVAGFGFAVDGGARNDARNVTLLLQRSHIDVVTSHNAIACGGWALSFDGTASMTCENVTVIANASTTRCVGAYAVSAFGLAASSSVSVVVTANQVFIMSANGSVTSATASNNALAALGIVASSGQNTLTVSDVTLQATEGSQIKAVGGHGAAVLGVSTDAGNLGVNYLTGRSLKIIADGNAVLSVAAGNGVATLGITLTARSSMNRLILSNVTLCAQGGSSVDVSAAMWSSTLLGISSSSGCGDAATAIRDVSIVAIDTGKLEITAATCSGCTLATFTFKKDHNVVAASMQRNHVLLCNTNIAAFAPTIIGPVGQPSDYALVMLHSSVTGRVNAAASSPECFSSAPLAVSAFVALSFCSFSACNVLGWRPTTVPATNALGGNVTVNGVPYDVSAPDSLFSGMTTMTILEGRREVHTPVGVVSLSPPPPVVCPRHIPLTPVPRGVAEYLARFEAMNRASETRSRTASLSKKRTATATIAAAPATSFASITPDFKANESKLTTTTPVPIGVASLSTATAAGVHSETAAAAEENFTSNSTTRSAEGTQLAPPGSYSPKVLPTLLSNVTAAAVTPLPLATADAGWIVLARRTKTVSDTTGIAGATVAVALGSPIALATATKATQLGRMMAVSSCASSLPTSQSSFDDASVDDAAFVWTRDADWAPSAIVALASTCSAVLLTTAVAFLLPIGVPDRIGSVSAGMFAAVLAYYGPNLAGLAMAALSTQAASTGGGPDRIALAVFSLLVPLGVALGTAIAVIFPGDGKILLHSAGSTSVDRWSRATRYFVDGVVKEANGTTTWWCRIHGSVDFSIAIVAAMATSAQYRAATSCAFAAGLVTLLYAGQLVYLLFAHPLEDRANHVFACANAVSMGAMGVLAAVVAGAEGDRAALLTRMLEYASLALCVGFYCQIAWDIGHWVRRRLCSTSATVDKQRPVTEVVTSSTVAEASSSVRLLLPVVVDLTNSPPATGPSTIPFVSSHHYHYVPPGSKSASGVHQNPLSAPSIGQNVKP